MHTGLAKAEDKSRGYRTKKQEGPSPEDVRKKVQAPTSTISKEVPAPVAHPAPGGGCCVVGPGPGLDCGACSAARGWGGWAWTLGPALGIQGVREPPPAPETPAVPHRWS